MKSATIAVLGIGIGIILGIGFCKTYYEEAAKTQAPAALTVKEVKADIIITYETDGFHPVTIPGKVGQTIAVVNKTTNVIRAVSNPHPIHNLTPDFDSGDLDPGDNYVYTIKKTGTIGFHNHYSPGDLGEVVVQ